MRPGKSFLALIVLALVASACAAPQTPQPTATSLPASPTAVPPTATVVLVEAATPTAEITPTEVVTVDYCVDCHTDKDQLILTAAPEKKVEKESEGAG